MYTDNVCARDEIARATATRLQGSGERNKVSRGPSVKPYRGDRRDAWNTRICPPTSVDWITTINCRNFSRMKEVIKQGNAVNLYYLSSLGMVMLRPVLVVLSSGAWDDSPP
jgi:hypothetical protein